jgi:hypothetical protein
VVVASGGVHGGVLSRTERELTPRKVLYYFSLVILTLLNSAALASLVAGVTFDDMYTGRADWRRFAIFCAAIAAVQFIVLAVIPRSASRLALKEGSSKFATFFADWYGGSGHLRLYSNDVEWLEGKGNAAILDEVKKKAESGRVEIFLRNYRGNVVKELLKLNATIFVIPDTVKLRTRMSLRDDEGSMHLLLRLGLGRDSGAERSKVALVRATTDQYWCDLAKETMDACRTGQQVQLTPDGTSVVLLAPGARIGLATPST